MTYIRLIILIALCLSGSCVIAAAQGDLFYGGFEGRWEGKFQILPSEIYDKDRGMGTGTVEYAFSIKGKDVSVYARPLNGSWKESKPGNYHLVALKTNAIIVAITSAADVEDKTGTGGWVETVEFTITHKDQGGLYVVFTRMINNYLDPYDHRSTTTGLPDARYVGIGYGEMTKVDQP